jgi:preprotein translocase subunit SecG
MAGFLFYLTITLFILVCLILILLILIQKGRGGGLSGAFGGAGGNTAFGAKTGDVLTWATSVIFGVFVLLAISLNLLANYRHDHMSNGLTTSYTLPSSAAVPAMPASKPPTPAPVQAPVEVPTSQPAK